MRRDRRLRHRPSRQRDVCPQPAAEIAVSEVQAAAASSVRRVVFACFDEATAENFLSLLHYFGLLSIRGASEGAPGSASRTRRCGG